MQLRTPWLALGTAVASAVVLAVLLPMRGTFPADLMVAHAEDGSTSHALQGPLVERWRVDAPRTIIPRGSGPPSSRIEEQNDLTSHGLVSHEGVIVLPAGRHQAGVKFPVNGYDALTGAKLWTTYVSGIGLPGAAYNGLFYIRQGDNHIHGIDVHTGIVRDQIRPRSAEGDLVYAIADGLIVMNGNGGLAAYDLVTKKLRWHFPAIHQASGAYADGLLFTRKRGPRPKENDAADALVAREIQTGRVIWSRDGFFPSVAAHGGAVYSASTDTFFAFRAESGEVLWRVPLPPDYFPEGFNPFRSATESSPLNTANPTIPFPSPAVDDDLVVFTNSVGDPGVLGRVRMVALDRRTGTIRWSFSQDGTRDYRIRQAFHALDAKNLYLLIQVRIDGIMTHRLLILDRQTGEEQQRIEHRLPPGNEPAYRPFLLANKLLYVTGASPDGTRPQLIAYQGQGPAAQPAPVPQPTPIVTPTPVLRPTLPPIPALIFRSPVGGQWFSVRAALPIEFLARHAAGASTCVRLILDGQALTAAGFSALNLGGLSLCPFPTPTPKPEPTPTPTPEPSPPPTSEASTVPDMESTRTP